MLLTKANADAVERLEDLGLSLDQALLALVKTGWDAGRAADASTEHVFTVMALERSKVKACANGCGSLTGGHQSAVCCKNCSSAKGPHTPYCRQAQAARREKQRNAAGRPVAPVTAVGPDDDHAGPSVHPVIIDEGGAWYVWIGPGARLPSFVDAMTQTELK